MTAFDQFAVDTLRIVAAAIRLETLERRHQTLAAGLDRLKREAESPHHLGRSGARQIARMARLDRLIAYGEAEALRAVEMFGASPSIGDHRG